MSTSVHTCNQTTVVSNIYLKKREREIERGKKGRQRERKERARESEEGKEYKVLSNKGKSRPCMRHALQAAAAAGREGPLFVFRFNFHALKAVKKMPPGILQGCSNTKKQERSFVLS